MSGSSPPGTTSGVFGFVPNGLAFVLAVVVEANLVVVWFYQLWRWWWFVAGLLYYLFCVFVVGGGWFISDGDWGLVRRRG